MTNPLTRILPAARQRIERPSRRQAIRAISFAGAGAIFGSVAGQGVVDPVVEPVAAPIREALYGDTPPGPSPYMREPLDKPGDMAAVLAGCPAIAAAVEANASNGLRSIPDAAAGRCTLLQRKDDRMWVRAQGHEAAMKLWGGEPRIDIPMEEQPDPAFAVWRQNMLLATDWRRQISLDLIRAPVRRKVHRFVAIAIPSDLGVFVFTSDEPPTPRPAARSTPPTIPRYT